MTDEYGDIARRLREEGQATAPPDLLPSVMADVHAEPRAPARRRRPSWPRWQPLAAWTAGAAALVALGFGLAHLPSSGSSSSSSAPMAANATHAAAGSLSPNSPTSGQAYTLPESEARHILGKFFPPTPSGLKLAGLMHYRVDVPATVYGYYAAKLRRAQARALGTPAYSATRNPVVIRLFRAHHSATP